MSVSEPTLLPDGWERVDTPAPYHKYVARDAIAVTDHAGSVRFHRDVVVLVNTGNDSVGVTKGPCYRSNWPADDPDAAGRRLATTLQAWLDDGNGPHGDDDLYARLEQAVTGGGQQ